MYELTVFVLTVTRENHSLAFVFFILYRFQGSVLGVSRSSDVSIPQASTFVNTFFSSIFSFFEPHSEHSRSSFGTIFGFSRTAVLLFRFITRFRRMIYEHFACKLFLKKSSRFSAHTDCIQKRTRRQGRVHVSINSAGCDGSRSSRGSRRACRRAAGRAPGFPCRNPRRLR